MIFKIRIKNLHVTAMAVWPFIFYKKPVLGIVTARHERIHHRQQLEMALVFFYVWYFAEYLIHLVVLRNHQKAYRRISFEREAYANARNKQYLSNRKIWSWRKYL